MKKYNYLFLIFYLPFICLSQGKENCRSREYVIQGAQLANQSYTFSKLSYFVNNQTLAARNIDSAAFYIQQSIMAIDSAIILASDSELMALDYSNIAKKFANRSYKLLNACRQTTNINIRLDYAKQATFYSANVVTDAYHASFYFKDCKIKEQKDTTPPAPKQLTKLDVDQALFTLLNEHLTEKTEDHKKEISKLSQTLKATKDPVKTTKINEQIKKLEKEDTELALKNKNAKEKLNTINTQIDERDKNKNAAIVPEETVFSKSLKKPADEWNKPVLLDTELPMGLVYQIQIGLYKNGISTDVFKGLTPVFGKTVLGGVSYSTGMFEKIADANEAKTYVKSIGLTDAFVVAYFNRKKITLAEAAKLENR
ncbi:MAG: hypothetical protein ABI388_06320 [Bacteroidia bacterium]